MCMPRPFLKPSSRLTNLYLHLGRLERGESVLIHAAASGVGSAAVQLAHVAGAIVYGTADKAKLNQVRQLGADVTIAYEDTDFGRAVTEGSNGRGVDVILDFIGAANFERNFASLAAGGRPHSSWTARRLRERPAAA